MTARDEARAALQRAAEAQRDAYAKMLELDGGVGRLGLQHPEMFEAMQAWDELTANGHADTVLALLDEPVPADEREPEFSGSDGERMRQVLYASNAIAFPAIQKVVDMLLAADFRRQGPITDDTECGCHDSVRAHLQAAYDAVVSEYAAYRRDRQEQMTRIRAALDDAHRGARTGNLMTPSWVVKSIDDALSAWRGEPVEAAEAAR